MILFPDVIFQTRVGLSFFESFEKASEFALSYRVGKIEMGRGTLVLLSPYLKGWIWYREVVLTIRQVAANTSTISMIGKPVLSPLHLFRIPYFLTGRVYREKLLRDAEDAFMKYQIDEFAMTATARGDAAEEGF
jgi:hypothetical protein